MAFLTMMLILVSKTYEKGTSGALLQVISVNIFGKVFRSGLLGSVVQFTDAIQHNVVQALTSIVSVARLYAVS